MLPQGRIIRCSNMEVTGEERVRGASGARGQREGRELVPPSKANSGRRFAVKGN